MFTALAAAAALSFAPAQPDGLKLTNVRWTIGELGPTRKESKLIPGDLLFIGYDIENLTIDADGYAKYTMGMEVSDAAGKSIFKQDPRTHGLHPAARQQTAGASLPCDRLGPTRRHLLVQAHRDRPENKGHEFARREV